MSYQALAMLETNKEALELYSEGLTTKEVAAKIGMNKRTLEQRVGKMFKATGKGTMTGLVVFAIKNEIIKL